MAIFLNGNGMQRSGIAEGGMVAIETVSTDNVGRFPSGLRAIAYDIPIGYCGAYYTECNVLIPLGQHAEWSKVPAAKSVPVHIIPKAMTATVGAAAE
jgi:anaerobic selenocysteine-containing dehydrogenase